MNPRLQLPFKVPTLFGDRLHRDSIESLVHYAAEIGRIAQRIEANREERGVLSVADDVASEIAGRMWSVVEDCDGTWFPSPLIKVAGAISDAAYLLREAVMAGDVVLDESLHPINEMLRDLSVDEHAGGEGMHVSLIVIDEARYQLAVDYLYRAVKLLIGPAREAGVDTTILATYDLED